MEAAIGLAAGEGRSRIVVSTAAADTGNLRFYQRLGFRMRDIERDAFTAATGYDSVILDGIELRSNRNAIYKSLFDARRKLRRSLEANGHVGPDALTST